VRLTLADAHETLATLMSRRWSAGPSSGSVVDRGRAVGSRIVAGTLCLTMLACGSRAGPTSTALDDTLHRVITDESGDSLARLVREHEVTPDEAAITAALAIALATSVERGEAHPLLARWDSTPFVERMISRYPSLAAAASASLRAGSETLISAPPTCADNCLPTVGEIRDIGLDRLREFLASGDATGALTDVVDEIGERLASEPRDADIASAIPPSELQLWLNAFARSSGLIALAARIVGAAVAAEVAGAVLLVVLVISAARALDRFLGDAARLTAQYVACSDWQTANCDDAGADDVDAGTVAPSRDGGPAGGSEDAGEALGGEITTATCRRSTDGMSYHDVYATQGDVGSRIGVTARGIPMVHVCTLWHGGDEPTDGGVSFRDETFCERRSGDAVLGNWTGWSRMWDLTAGSAVDVVIQCVSPDCAGEVLASRTATCD
jgi:hypothetical protein